ncbi:unnamed protein product [Staurois parvus]|uniref:Uncharacterized protein n=1 Tax=Staurois parvus TaxID=386267 RepID=A0ABN9AU96_9NEOB|nr:unnamed protein product [Staurois parvus]
MWHGWVLAGHMDEHSELALMDTDRWHCWGYTDHQGTLIYGINLNIDQS